MTPVTPGHPVSPDNSGIPCADGSASHEAVRPDSRRVDGAYRGGKGLVALATVCLLCGCGGGLDFTGGSIPPGGARLFGRVAAAENPLQPLAHATIQVESRPITGGVRTLQVTSAADGSFDFISVPSGSTSTTMTVTVTPDPAQGRQAQQIVFGAVNGRADNLIVTLPRADFKVGAAQTLTVQDIATLPPGDTVAVHTRLLDAGGTRLPVQPTLLFAGNFGNFAADETFTAAEPGTGTITAFWYTLPAATTQIIVARNALHLPPSPPDLPPVTNPPQIDLPVKR